MYDNITPTVIALHGSLVELTLRVSRIERKLGVEPGPLLTFGQTGGTPLDVEPCGCDEAVALRARIRELESAVARLAVQP